MLYKETYLCSVVAYLATGLISSASEPLYRFSGAGDVNIESNLTSHSTRSPNNVTHFQLDFDSGSWQIRTERNVQDGTTGKQLDLKVLVGSTNSDIFGVLYGRQGGSTNWICLGASARTGPVPYVVMEPSIQMLWVALISQYAFKSNGRQMFPPVFFPYSPALYDARFLMPVDVTHNDSVPHFISDLTAYLDKWRYWDEPLDVLVMPPLERPLPAPYESGCTNFVYSVREFSHTELLTWPSRFDFTFYGMKNGASSSAELRVLGPAHGVVRAFVANVQPQIASFIPGLPPGTIVSESRFISDDNPVFTFGYVSAGIWQTKAQLVKSPEYVKEMRNQALLKPSIRSRPHRQPPTRAGAFKMWAWIALTSVTVLSATAYWFLARKQTNNK